MDAPFNNRVARKIGEARAAFGLSQVEFADELEASQQTVSRLERGKVPQSWHVLSRLHVACDIDLNELLAGE